MTQLFCAAILAVGATGCGGKTAATPTPTAPETQPKNGVMCLYEGMDQGKTAVEAAAGCKRPGDDVWNRNIAYGLGKRCMLRNFGAYSLEEALRNCWDRWSNLCTDADICDLPSFQDGTNFVYVQIRNYGLAGLPAEDRRVVGAGASATTTTIAEIAPVQPPQPPHSQVRVLRRFRLPKADEHDPGGSCLETNGRYRWPGGNEGHAAFCGGRTNACYVYDPGRQAWQFITDNAFDAPQPYHAACAAAGDAISSGADGD
jgi:hypothetical protein